MKSKLIERARFLRRNQTSAEKFLWEYLRNRGVANAKFRRQHPIEQYILDFYCPEHSLAIELNGSQHFTGTGMCNDIVRTARLYELGIRILRFKNHQVFNETEKVLETICKAIVI